MASLRLVMLILFCVVFGFRPFGFAANFLTDDKYRCAFIDTVNVTESFTHSSSIGVNRSAYLPKPNHNNNNDVVNDDHIMSHNHSNGIVVGGNSTYYIHDGIVIPRDLVAVYDFVVRNGIRVPVASHLRACVCKLKPCIRFCCAQGHYYDVINHTCSLQAREDINNTMNPSTMLVLGQNGSYSRISTAEHFIANTGPPCERMHTVYTDSKELIQWTLLANGTIVYKHHHFTKLYCYSPYRLGNMTWTWQPLACTIEKLTFILGVREWTYVICLILATICMSIIFFMHLCVTELRNTFYGVAIKAYSICIIVGHSLMIHVVLTDPVKMTKTSCAFIPCFILFFVLLSFYILTFISFNFYLNFHGIFLTKLMFWLIFFPIASLAIGWSLFVGFERYGGKPVFGGDTCWFDPRNWAIMIYFNAPILVACSVSVFFYILTLIRIREQQESGSKNLSTALEENRYTVFWQFFSYTFITWLVCVISFVINYYRDNRTHINYAVCLVVILHGFGSLYALIGRNQQIQNFLRRIEDGIDEDDEEVCESALPMTPLERD